MPTPGTDLASLRQLVDYAAEKSCAVALSVSGVEVRRRGTDQSYLVSWFDLEEARFPFMVLQHAVWRCLKGR